VLVRVLASGICGSKLQEISGFKGNGKFLPHLMGHEGFGIIEAIGPGVTRIKSGDSVVMHWRTGAGIESDFPQYVLDGTTITSGKVTTLSEFSIVSENRLTKVPADTPKFLGALLGCGLSTALGVINNEIDLKFGESVAVFGCGGVGLNLIQAAKLGAAHPIIGFDINDSKKKLVISAGADAYVNSNSSNVEELVKEYAGEKTIDVIIDTTGIPSVIDLAIKLLSDNGRLILVGQPKPGSDIFISNALSLFGAKSKIIKTTQGGRTSPNEDIPRYLKLYNAGKLEISSVITDIFSIDDGNKAIDKLRSGEAGRIMIDMEK
jgi:Zn-dependent alcohol dehydrogenase